MLCYLKLSSNLLEKKRKVFNLETPNSCDWSWNLFSILFPTHDQRKEVSNSGNEHYRLWKEDRIGMDRMACRSANISRSRIETHHHPRSCHTLETLSRLCSRTILFRVPDPNLLFGPTANRFPNHGSDRPDLRDRVLRQPDPSHQTIRHRSGQIFFSERKKDCDPREQDFRVDGKDDSEAFVAVAFVEWSGDRQSEVNSFFEFREICESRYRSHSFH